MLTLLDRVAGLDVHKATVVASVRVPDGHGGRATHTATFATTTPGVLALRDWLAEWAVTHAAMESTGDYWKPVYYVLEDHVTLLLVNAQHLTQVPGRKTDTRDSAWIAQLLECGLLRGSFVPPPPIRELRDLTRYRKETIRDRSREVNRLQRVLEDAGLKLTTVAADVMGVSGRAMLAALLEGTTDPATLADLAHGKLRRKLPALREALTGRFRAHHAFLLGQILTKITLLEDVIADLSQEIERHLSPFAAAAARLQTIPGVKQRTAEVLLAETGGDMRPFPSAAHLCSWAALCPGQHQSAGRTRTGKTRHGNAALRTALMEAAHAAARTNGTALQARYRRLKARRGHQRAILAVAHQILKITYYLLATEATYDELGPDYFDRRHTTRAIRRHVRQLEQLGYHVTLEAVA
jgi:transposase